MKIKAWILSSKLMPTELNYVRVELSSFRWLVIGTPSDIFKLNSVLIKCTLFEVVGFSYIFDNKAFIKPFVVVPVALLKATFWDNVNRIVSSAYLSIKSQSSCFILFGFIPERDLCIFYGTDNLESTFFKNQNLILWISQS